MRLFETSELVLFAALMTVLDHMSSLRVVLSGAHVYMDSTPILALYATKAAVAVKTVVGVFLLVLFMLVKHRAFRTPRRDKMIRAALHTYIAFIYATNVVLLFTLESLSVPPVISYLQ